MKKYLTLISLTLIMAFALSSCRPKDLEGAFVHFNQKRFDQAHELALATTKQYPQNPEGWYLLGVLEGKKDNIPAMVAAFDKSLEISGQFKAKIDNEKHNYYASSFNKAVTGFNTFIKSENKEDSKVIEGLENSIVNFQNSNLIKQNYKAVDLLGQSYILLNKTDKAEEAYKLLTKNYPDTATSHFSLGKFYYGSKKYNDALTSFKKASELDASNAEVLTFTAQTYDVLEMPDKAIPYYKKAIEANTTDAAIPFNLGLLLYKAAAEPEVDENTKKEKLGMSIEFFTKAIELNPDYKHSYVLKGNAQLLLGNFGAAKETLEVGVEKFPEDAQMWEDLAKSYSNLSETEKAKAAFKKADALMNK